VPPRIADTSVNRENGDCELTALVRADRTWRMQAVWVSAHVKAVQRMPGHAFAAMTLDVYASLFDDLDSVATALDHAKRATDVVEVLLSRERGRED